MLNDRMPYCYLWPAWQTHLFTISQFCAWCLLKIFLSLSPHSLLFSSIVEKNLMQRHKRTKTMMQDLSTKHVETGAVMFTHSLQSPSRLNRLACGLTSYSLISRLNYVTEISTDIVCLSNGFKVVLSLCCFPQ